MEHYISEDKNLFYGFILSVLYADFVLWICQVLFCSYGRLNEPDFCVMGLIVIPHYCMDFLRSIHSRGRIPAQSCGRAAYITGDYSNYSLLASVKLTLL